MEEAVQGDDRATYSVLSLSMSVPISTHIALLTASTSSLIELFQLPLLLPWINSPSPRCRSRSSFPRLLLPCTLVPFSCTKFCLAANALPTFPLHSRPILLASFISPQFLLPRFYLLWYRPILLSAYFLPRPKFFCCSSVSYSLAPFFWLNVYLAPVISSLLSLTVLSHSFGLTFILPQLFHLFSLLQSRPIR